MKIFIAPSTKRVKAWLYRLALLFLLLFIAGLVDLCAQLSPPRRERVERIGAFSADTLETKYGFVRFEQGNGRYGFDLGVEKWYQKTTILDAFYKPFGKGYIAPWKLIPVGEQDEVIAKYEGRNISNLAKVRFASASNSPAIPAEFDESTKTWKLSLPATDVNSTYDVFALYEGKVIGKFRVVSYPKQNYKLRLVPVNGQSVGDVSRLSQQLNGIYNKYGVSFTLYEGEGMTATFSSANLKAELKELNKQYKQEHTLTSEDVCIFVLNEELSKGSKYEEVEGLMQRGKRFGYIFAGNSPNEDKLARTLAHELGHGLFTLGHTFDSDYNKGRRGVTNNLMDYGDGATELAAYQWNIMANPAPFTGFDRDKDAQFSSGAVLTPNLDLIRVVGTNSLYVSAIHSDKLVQGTLPGFVLRSSGDTKEYYAWDGSNYRSTSSDKSYTIESKAYTDVPIYLFYNLDRECGRKAYVVVSYSDLSEVLKLKKDGQIDAARKALLRLILKKESSSKIIACTGSESPSNGAWVEQSASLDCAAEDLVALQKNYQESLKSKLGGDLKELVGLLKQYSNEPCFFEHIGIEERLKILGALIRSDADDSTWEFSFGKLSLGDSFFLDKLILSTPKRDRLRLLRDGFMANQGKWLEVIFNKSKGFWNNDVTIADILPLATGLASWVKEYYAELNIPISVETIRNIGHPDLNEYSYPIASVTPICIGVPDDGSSAFYTQQSDRGYTYKLFLRAAPKGHFDGGRAIVSQKFLGRLAGTYITQPGTSILSERPFTSELNLNLFEPVVLLASRDYGVLGIKAGEEYIVPAFLAVIYQQLLSDQASWERARSAGNYLAIGVAALASPYTLGGSWSVYTTVGAGLVAGVDEALKDGRLKLGSSAEYDAQHKDFYEAWEALYNTAMATDAVVNAPQLVRAIRKVNLTKALKRLNERAKTPRSIELVEVLTQQKSSSKANLPNLELAGDHSHLTAQLTVIQQRAKEVGLERIAVLETVDAYTRLTKGQKAEFLQMLKDADDTTLRTFENALDELLRNVGKDKSWLNKLHEGRKFNEVRSKKYQYNEVYLISPNNPKAYVILDSYSPSVNNGEIVSRKYTQLGSIDEKTAIGYLREFAEKYPPGTTIADVDSNTIGRNAGIFEVNQGNTIQGQMILEVPVQTNNIPQKVLDIANKNYIKIRDITGKTYN